MPFRSGHRGLAPTASSALTLLLAVSSPGCFSEAADVDSGGGSSTGTTTNAAPTTGITDATSSTSQSGSTSGGGSSSGVGTSGATTTLGSSSSDASSGSTGTTDDSDGTTGGTTSSEGSTGVGSTGEGSTGDATTTDATTGENASQVVWFHGDFETNNTDAVGRADRPEGSPNELSLGGDIAATIDTIAVSADQTQLAVGGRDITTGEAQVFIYDAQGAGAPVIVYTGPTTATFTQIAFSPDGQSLAFIADGATDGHHTLYVVPTAGMESATPISPQADDADLDVDIFAWSRDSSRIAYIGDVEVNNADGIWAVDPSARTPTPVALYPTDSLALDNRVRNNMLEFDAAGRAYFVFESSDDSFSAHRANTDGTGLEAVPGSNLTNEDGSASVIAFGISDAGDEVAFAADSPNAGVFEVWVAGTGGTTAERVSDVSASSLGGTGPVPTHPIVWSPDGMQLAVVSDWIVDGSLSGDDALWLLPSAGPAGGTRLLRPDANSNGQDVSACDFSADGTRLFALGDLVDANATELFETDDFASADQSQTDRRLVSVPTDGDVRQLVTDR